MEGKSRILVVLAICILILCAAPAWSTVIRVSPSGSNGNGSTWALAKTTINAALSAASNGDEIWVAEGTSYSISNSVPDGVDMYGGFEGTESSCDERNWATHLTVVTSGSVSAAASSYDITIDGFKFTGLSGIALTGDVTFSHNVVTDCDSITPVFSCTGVVKLLNNLIYNNDGELGRDEHTTVIACASSNGNPTIINNTIAYNGFSDDGSGGAAIDCTNTTTTISNNIIAYNMVCGIRDWYGDSDLSHNCVYGHGYGDYVGDIYYYHSTDINVNPLFVSASNLHLQSNSPCIDAGDDNEVGTGWVDLDANLRQVDHVSGGSIVDIGAYEYPDTTAPSTPTVTDDGAYTASDDELHFTWTAASDAESGIAKYWYAIGTTSGGTDTRNWTEVSSSPLETTATGLTLSSGNTYYISVKAENGQGLIGTAGVSDGIIVDTVAPNISSASLTSLSYANSSFNISYSNVTDALSGLKEVTLWYKYGTEGSWTPGPTNTSSSSSGSFTFTPSSGDGTYHFALSAKDNVDNGTGTPTTDLDDTKYDTEDPEVSVTSPSDSEIHVGYDISSINFEGTATDEWVGVETVEVGFGSTLPATWDSATYNSTTHVWTYTWTNPSPTAGYMWVRATDYADNSTTISLTVTSVEVVYVKPNGAGLLDGTSWDNAYASVQDAIDDASQKTPIGEVWVAGESSTPYYADAICIYMREGVDVYGGFAGNESLREERDWEQHVTILDGKDSQGNPVAGPVVWADSNSRLDGFTLRNGSGEYVYAGGIAIYADHDVTIANNKIIDNNIGAGTGGGILCASSSALICNNVIKNNSSAFWGSAIECEGGYYDEVTEEWVYPIIKNNEITENGNTVYTNYGGPITCWSSAAQITTNYIADNFQYGGNSSGIYCIGILLDHKVRIENNIINDNAVATNEVGNGAIYSRGSCSCDIINNTIVGNVGCDGIYLDGDDTNGAPTFNVINNIVVDNDYAGIHCFSVANITLENNDSYGQYPYNYDGIATVPISNISEDPDFEDAQNNDFHIESISPCRNTGLNTAPNLPLLDWDGQNRINTGDGFGIVDMGVDEYYAP